MEFIERKVKGYKKSYTTSNGKRKYTKPSLNVYLGANTPFNVDDDVILLDGALFNKLDDALGLRTKSLDEIQIMLDEFMEFQTNKSDTAKNSLELQGLIDTINNKDKLLDDKEKELQELRSEIAKHKNVILRDTKKENEYIKKLNYYERLEDIRANYGLLDRLRNKDPKHQLELPSTPLLDSEK